MLISKMQWLYLLLSSLVIHSKALDIVQTKKKKELETSNESSALVNAIKDQESKENDGDLWIVLVSGIPARLAYSTESDICRTYQIAKRNGIPDERIIVFMHDIAGPEHNDTLYNEEGGPNVYIGVPKDYTGDNWTKENFLNVLRGKEMMVGSGKTLRTKKHDRVFISFESHGGPGGVAMFGNGMLKSNELYETISYMHQHHMYQKVVIYWMTCFSGAMFVKYSPKYQKKNVYVVTSQTPYDESLACKHERTTDGQIMCSLFGRVWMEHVESIDTSAETMQLLYVNLTAETVEDSVGFQVPLEYGDKHLDKLLISDFMGTGDASKPGFTVNVNSNSKPVGAYPTLCDAFSYELQMKFKATYDQKDSDNLQYMIDSIETRRKEVAKKVNDIVEDVTDLQNGNDVNGYDKNQQRTKSWEEVYSEMTLHDINDCFYQMVDAFRDKCGSVHNDDWCSITHPTKEFMKLCNSRFSMDLFDRVISRHC